MTQEEAVKHYPGCPEAIYWQEQPEMAVLWDWIRSYGAGPDKTVEKLLQCARETLEILPEGEMSLAFAQMKHPDFRKYVNVKLGGM